MDNNNWRPAQTGGDPVMDQGDWRNQLQPDSRQKIVNKIMETLKRHLPFSGSEGINELSRIAARFEEKIYASAVNQTDYLRKISMKMLTMENRSQKGQTVGLNALEEEQDWEFIEGELKDVGDTGDSGCYAQQVPVQRKERET